jgi:hypothetical protein
VYWKERISLKRIGFRVACAAATTSTRMWWRFDLIPFGHHA